MAEVSVVGPYGMALKKAQNIISSPAIRWDLSRLN